MRKVVLWLGGILSAGMAVIPAQAAFTSLYVFGDGLSTTTNNPSPGPHYYGKRYSNGRVWVEVLAQRQGLTYDPNKNWSYFYDSCTGMLANVTSFQVPSDASNDLFVIWVNCADLWFQSYYDGTNMASWTNAINQSQTNHYKAATNLYAKGVRTLIMPNAVDLSTIPQFNTSANVSFIHLRCRDYNLAFSNTLNRIRVACPNLSLYTPDYFALLTNLLSHPTSYGVTNALGGGLSIDAINAVNFGYPAAATNGFGTNFIFWDPTDPTAKVHEIMADAVQQLISPAQIGRVTFFNGSNRLDLARVPVGLNGLVLGCTNLMQSIWTTNATFVGSNVTQSVYVTNSGPLRYYRVNYPDSWKWP